MSRDLCRLHYGRAKLSGVRGELDPDTLAALANGVIPAPVPATVSAS
jgi:hypothetical protein